MRRVPHYAVRFFGYQHDGLAFSLSAASSLLRPQMSCMSHGYEAYSENNVGEVDDCLRETESRQLQDKTQES